ncbi:hypothetical protein ASPBRDRAFT_352858 [Aspergillus brasiliensis CBS 101740]|uniref:Uncharacterized protein n=1 Tax=Aspergillus brasiliensis (strain CBS 101740 / IMI 381727 / IBT 21946) TaxID=767769 RepID=A0A1L9U6F6_ASPBC|nr:hypothetical protein ASPBRDRAFT_352858 [Aspergillus brasiliensis CBS 101740]
MFMKTLNIYRDYASATLLLWTSTAIEELHREKPSCCVARLAILHYIDSSEINCRPDIKKARLLKGEAVLKLFLQSIWPPDTEAAFAVHIAGSSLKQAKGTSTWPSGAAPQQKIFRTPASLDSREKNSSTSWAMMPKPRASTTYASLSLYACSAR